MKKLYIKGYTLMEILVVVMIFSILGLVITRVISTTLRSSGKSENIILVRENVSYAMGVIGRNIRSAQEITTCTGTLLEYENFDGEPEEYECVVSGGRGRITSTELGNGNLTSDDISVDCSSVFDCSGASPPPDTEFVDLSINAMDAASVGSENALTSNYGESIRIRLRNFQE